MQCSPCGGLVNYVDESNKLVINADKTHLLVMGTIGG